MITGKDLIARGYVPGPHFTQALETLNKHEHDDASLDSLMRGLQPAPTLPLQPPATCHYNITATTPAEEENLAKVKQTMDVVLRTPGAVSAAVMPDACPAGPVGVIPVGAVVAMENAIVPGMHSADICCSLMLSEFDLEPKKLLDQVHSRTHFGPTGAKFKGMSAHISRDLLEEMAANPYFDKAAIDLAVTDLGTQGDGNHFAYVGTRSSTGKTCLVTHHGSRGVGARVFKAGQKVAEKFRKQISPDTPKYNGWIPFDTQEGKQYWEALQIVRDWTRLNHWWIHDLPDEYIWNEHNFVFRDDSRFYHAKGATPLLDKFLPDTQGTQIIPLNMAEPILLVQGERSAHNLGFAPHGAGRNFSRTQHINSLGEHTIEEVFAKETAGIDARFFSGKPDLSELPSAYKPAGAVVDDIESFGLCKVVDRVEPYGCIMAGEFPKPWLDKKKRR